jgi:hypothetical protein
MILDNKQVYNAAIVLNNIGVDLLERRCYKQALATLVDATNIMQAVLRRLLSSETNDKLDVEAIIQRANRCRANPTAIESNSYYRIVNLADDYSGILMEEDNGSSSLRESIYPIRIYDVNFDAYSPGCLSDPEMQSAILLHNMGLAHLCLARVTPLSGTSLKHAIQLFELSESIVESCASDAMEDGPTMEDELTLRQIACLDMAILFGLLRSLSSPDEIESVQLHLRSIRSVLSESDKALSWLTLSIQGAPAA